MKGYFCKKKYRTKKKLKEFRVKNLEKFIKQETNLGLEIFKDIKFVDIKSKTIGKGFAGGNEKTQFQWVKSYSWCFCFT